MSKSLNVPNMNDDVYFAFRDTLTEMHGEDYSSLCLGEVSEVEVPFFDAGKRLQSFESQSCVACKFPCAGSSHTRYVAEEGDSFYICSSCQDILDI